MKTKYLIALGFIVAVVSGFILTSNVLNTSTTEEVGDLASVNETSHNEVSIEPEKTRALINSPEVTQSQIEETLEQIKDRVRVDQIESTLSELEELVGRYDEMSHAEKRELLTAYATYFLRNSQYDDARYFYEQILQLPDLDYTNRLAILQMLARISIASEDWESFLIYNDQYFDEGGGYNWVVTRNLISAFQQLGNFNAAGEALLLHFETGIHPEYDGSNEQYQRLYGRIDSIPLDMSDRESAIVVAEKMIEQFDRPQNWKILSELYNANDDVINFNQAIESARAKGFIDVSGNWIDKSLSQ